MKARQRLSCLFRHNLNTIEQHIQKMQEVVKQYICINSMEVKLHSSFIKIKKYQQNISKISAEFQQNFSRISAEFQQNFSRISAEFQQNASKMPAKCQQNASKMPAKSP
jgi:DNA repair ATPase RecN